jgi:predicted ABC-type ATPase
MEGGHDVPITKIISRYDKSIANGCIVSELADRTYVYDNSVDNADACLLFRLRDGKLVKKYVEDIPRWAQPIYKGGLEDLSIL